MFNHVRTLLLNELPQNDFQWGEEAVPEDFKPKRISSVVQLGLNALYGPTNDRAGKNWLLGIAAPLLHSTALDALTRRSDSRITYWPEIGAQPPDWSSYGTAEADTEGLTIYGTPEYVGGRALRRFMVVSDSSGLSVRNEQGTLIYSVEDLPTGPIELITGVRIKTDQYGSWMVTTVNRPVVKLSECVQRLETSGVLPAIWNKDPEAAAIYSNSGHIPEKFAAALVGLSTLIDQLP